VHPHHIRMALYLIGTDPQESPSLPEQLASSCAVLGVSHTWYDDAVETRGYTMGVLGAALHPYAETYAPEYAAAHLKGRTDRSRPFVPAMPGQRRLAKPVQFGRGSDTVIIPVGHVVDVLQAVVERPDGNRYALVAWGGFLALLGEPESRLEPLDPLLPEPDRWDVLRQIFEGSDPGVWGSEDDILADLRSSVSTAVPRDIQTARTAYRRDYTGTLPWVTARIDHMRSWRATEDAAEASFEERFARLKPHVQEACRREG